MTAYDKTALSDMHTADRSYADCVFFVEGVFLFLFPYDPR